MAQCHHLKQECPRSAGYNRQAYRTTPLVISAFLSVMRVPRARLLPLPLTLFALGAASPASGPAAPSQHLWPAIMQRLLLFLLAQLLPCPAWLQEKHVREELRKLLPREEGKAVEKPAEAQFRQRMWVQRLHAPPRPHGGGGAGRSWSKPCGLGPAVMLTVSWHGRGLRRACCRRMCACALQRSTVVRPVLCVPRRRQPACQQGSSAPTALTCLPTPTATTPMARKLPCSPQPTMPMPSTQPNQAVPHFAHITFTTYTRTQPSSLPTTPQ